MLKNSSLLLPKVSSFIIIHQDETAIDKKLQLLKRIHFNWKVRFTGEFIRYI